MPGFFTTGVIFTEDVSFLIAGFATEEMVMPRFFKAEVAGDSTSFELATLLGLAGDIDRPAVGRRGPALPSGVGPGGPRGPLREGAEGGRVPLS